MWLKIPTLTTMQIEILSCWFLSPESLQQLCKFTSQLSKFTIPDNICDLNKLQRLEVLHKAAGLTVDTFVFTDEINTMTEDVVTAYEREQVLNCQVLTPDGRFPCRFVSSIYSFKYDSKSWHKHELTHNPPPNVDEAGPQHSEATENEVLSVIDLKQPAEKKRKTFRAQGNSAG